MTFTDFSFSEKITEGLNQAGYVDCTPVQEQTLIKIQDKKDLITQSQTGTGKTAAFLLASYYLKENDPYYTDKMVLILVPTRELAEQVRAEADLLSKGLGYKNVAIYGSVAYNVQEAAIAEGIDYLIATPGRVIDLIDKKKLNLRDVGIFILDEADRMIDMGFMPDLRIIMTHLPSSDDRLTMLYSATLNSKVGNFAWEYMKQEPHEIFIEPKKVTEETIEQYLHHIDSKKKFSYLMGLLPQENSAKTLVFMNTKRAVTDLHQKLIRHGFKNEFISSDQPQKKRQQIIDDFKDEKFSILLATDVVARGIHVDSLDLVINYDLPTQAENYIHRIGRTARAGQIGKAISLVCEKFVYSLDEIETLLGKKIEVKPLDENLFVEEMRYERPQRSSRPSRKDNDGGRKSSSDDEFNRRLKKTQSNLSSMLTGGEHRPSGGKRSASRNDANSGNRRPKENRSSNGSRNEGEQRKRSDAARMPRIDLVNATPSDKIAFYSKKYDDQFKDISNFKPTLQLP